MRGNQDLVGRLKLVLVIFGVVFLVMGLRDMYYNSKTPGNFNDMLEADFQKGMIVEGDLYANLGSFEENYTTRNGVKTGNSKYNYMIPVGETQYMGLLNDTTTLETALDTQADLTFDYMLGETTEEPEPIHFKGRVLKMTDETKGYMRDYMIYLGFTENEVDSYILPYYIKCENYEAGWKFALVGFFCLLGGLLWVIIPLASAKKNAVIFADNNSVNSSMNSSYGGGVIQDDFDSFQSQTDNVDDTQPTFGYENTDNNTTEYNTTTEETSTYRSAFDDLDTTPSSTSTAGLGEGIADEKPKSGLSLKLKD